MHKEFKLSNKDYKEACKHQKEYERRTHPWNIQIIIQREQKDSDLNVWLAKLIIQKV